MSENINPRILVTGASGFIGKEVVNSILAIEKSNKVAIAVRKNFDHPSERVLCHKIKSLEDKIDWSEALNNISVVVCCSGRAHVMNERSAKPLEAFRKVNVEGTLNLAIQSAKAGVKRFIFLSSIKVNGESTDQDVPFQADDNPSPKDAYAISKYEAEQGLLKIAANTNMEVVIIRPALVYGLGVKGNFLSMLNWVNSGIPLPLGAINNKRSFVAIDNLVSFIQACLYDPKAANQIFLVSDGEDISTSDLIKLIYKIYRKPNRLINVPVSWLKTIAAISGKRSIISRLCDSCQINIDKSCHLLDWKPPLSIDEGLKKLIE